MKNLVKLMALSAVASTLVLTGCSNKRPKTSNVVVAPIGGGMGSAGYYGGGVGGNGGAGGMGAVGGTGSAVYFAYDSSKVDTQGANVLNGHAQALKSNNAHVVITGNTDERGSNEYNMALGERRAKAVQSYLASHGIPASRTEAVSNGENQPADPGHDESAWAKNRRAELSY